jgi:hypothetical protein
MALQETVSAQESDSDIRQLFVECLADSPYIPSQAKDQFANLVFANDLNQLNLQLQLPGDFHERVASRPCPTWEERLTMFRAMTATVFATSKVVSLLSLDRKRELGLAIQQSPNPHHLRELTISSLESSQAFGESARLLIANDVLDGRYDQLLLPDRFDCEDTSRVFADGGSGAREEEDCLICLMSKPANCQLPCPGQHRICRDCVEEWCSRFEGSTFTCPYCRSSCRSEDVISL